MKQLQVNTAVLTNMEIHINTFLHINQPRQLDLLDRNGEKQSPEKISAVNALLEAIHHISLPSQK